ncbi:MAG: hypothetical protein ABIR70_09935 [Bryobacteraceae bacterium]
MELFSGKLDAPTIEEKLAAARRLFSMNLPVSDVATMKREAVPTAAELMPDDSEAEA